jgi:hypothetical protein
LQMCGEHQGASATKCMPKATSARHCRAATLGVPRGKWLWVPQAGQWGGVGCVTGTVSGVTPTTACAGGRQPEGRTGVTTHLEGSVPVLRDKTCRVRAVHKAHAEGACLAAVGRGRRVRQRRKHIARWSPASSPLRMVLACPYRTSARSASRALTSGRWDLSVNMPCIKHNRPDSSKLR